MQVSYHFFFLNLFYYFVYFYMSIFANSVHSSKTMVFLSSSSQFVNSTLKLMGLASNEEIQTVEISTFQVMHLHMKILNF